MSIIKACQHKSYPHNPNGSEAAAASLCNDSGRVTIMMPHPERVFRTSAKLLASK